LAARDALAMQDEALIEAQARSMAWPRPAECAPGPSVALLSLNLLATGTRARLDDGPRDGPEQQPRGRAHRHTPVHRPAAGAHQRAQASSLAAGWHAGIVTAGSRTRLREGHPAAPCPRGTGLSARGRVAFGRSNSVWLPCPVHGVFRHSEEPNSCTSFRPA